MRDKDSKKLKKLLEGLDKKKKYKDSKKKTKRPKDHSWLGSLEGVTYKTY